LSGKTVRIATAISALVLCASLVSVASARAPTKTRVSIEAQVGGFFGFVHSRKHSCENNRTVVLYKQKGSQQRPSHDKRIGSDLAQPNGPDSQWSVNTEKSGNFYAKTRGVAGSCKGDRSKTVPSEDG
jgi:hypothetical protein